MGKFKVLRKAGGDTVDGDDATTAPDTADSTSSLAVDPSVASADGLDPADIPALLKAQRDYMTQAQATHAQQHQDAMDYLTRLQAGPSAGERLMQIGSSLVAPMQMRGLAGMLNNVGPVMTKQAADARTAQDERNKQMLLLQRQYGTDTLGDTKEGLTFSVDIAKLRQQAMMQRMAMAGKMLPQWKQNIGTGTVDLVPSPYDTVARPQSQAEIDALPPNSWYMTPHMAKPMLTPARSASVAGNKPSYADWLAQQLGRTAPTMPTFS